MKKFIAFILTAVILMCGFVGTVGATPKTQEYLTLQTPGTTIRNDFAAFVGMKLTVGNEDMTVTALGRLYYGSSWWDRRQVDLCTFGYTDHFKSKSVLFCC